MRKKLLFALSSITLLGLAIYHYGTPDYNNPAKETGTLELLGKNKFFLNGYELENLSENQEYQLHQLVGKTITVKGFFEKAFRKSNIEEIYVSEIIAH